MALRFIEHRRHSMRTKPGEHLSQAGVDLARRVGEGMASFNQVFTSIIPRAFETSIAMGFAVDRQLERISSMPDFERIIALFNEGFSQFSSYVRKKPESIVANFANDLAQFHLDLARSLPEGGRALLVSHGGLVEASAIGCMPDMDYESWGPSCNYCEGIRLTFDEGEFKECELIRVPGTILIN